MAAEDLIYLVKSYVDGDDDRFIKVVSHMAAREARQGHIIVAESLRKLILQVKKQNRIKVSSGELQVNASLTNASPHFPDDLAKLIFVSPDRQRLSHMVLPEYIEVRLRKIIEEQRRSGELHAYGLAPRNKILLAGPSGSGKTFTAHALAGEVDLPLMIIKTESLITKFLGESANKLASVFEAMYTYRGVYFFDEFDSIGSRRDTSNDIGEIKRLLNTFLQLLERDASHSIIIAATNHFNALDKALFRRFDDIIEYDLPDKSIIPKVLKARLINFDTKSVRWASVVDSAVGLSYSELSKSAEDAAKDAILDGTKKILTSALIRSIESRQSYIKNYK